MSEARQLGAAIVPRRAGAQRSPRGATRIRTGVPVARSIHARRVAKKRSARSSASDRGCQRDAARRLRRCADRARFSPENRAPRAAGASQKLRIQLGLRMVRFLTAGESHGRALVVILEGIPAGLPIDLDAITRDLRRRQGGYGRGRRMAIESDRAEILSGVRAGETIGGPIAMMIENRDWPNWQHTMRVGSRGARRTRGGARRAPVTRPRPGHADLAGVAKYGARRRPRHPRARQRARNRRARRRRRHRQAAARARRHADHQPRVRDRRRPRSPRTRSVAVRARRRAARRQPAALRRRRRRARDDRGDRSRRKEAGDTHGRRLRSDRDRRAGRPRQLHAMGSQARRPAGAGADVDPGDQGGRHRPRAEAAARPGSRVHDEIVPDAPGTRATGVARPTNNAGGLEGGVTNGEDLRVSAWMKPISTLMKPLRSVDLTTMAGSARGHRAQRRLRRARRGRRRRSDGGAGRSPTRSSTVRRRLDCRSRARGRARSTEAVRARFPVAMIRPILRYGERACSTSRRADVTQFDDRLAASDRRHDRDDVCGAGHRPGGDADRRSAAGLRHRRLGRPRPERARS